jgi:hypothetical protein
VQPEDGWAPRLSSSKEREILDKLASTGKKIAFFESGNRFLEYGAAPRRNNIFLIRTKYGAAVRNMITWAVEQHFGPVARLRDRACMHIVMVHGPANPAANERRRVYTEFAACLQADQGLSGSEPPSRVEWEELCSPLSNCELYVTSTIQKSWFRDEAKAAVLRHAKRIALASDGERACFFCGNDDMALGAVDAMRELKEEQAVANGQIAFCGFDGLEEFTQRIRRPGEFDGFRGATARVNRSRMRDVAVELVKTMGKSHATGDISIDAESIIASPVS